MLQRLYSWYGKRTVWGVGIAIVLLIVVAFVIARIGAGDTESNPTPQLRTVSVSSVATLSSENSITVIGSVEAVNESTIESEASGRIVSVPVELGDTVAAGELIAQIENAAERAAVLQAEGTYEAALASAAQSDVGVIDSESSLQNAKNTGLVTYRSAFTTMDDIVRNLVDELFSDPDSATPGFRLDSQGQANALNSERVSLEAILDAWNTKVFSSPSADDVGTLLLEAERDTKRIASFTDSISLLVAEHDPDSEFTESALSSLKTRFLTARTNANTTIQNVENALSDIEDAEETLAQSQLGGTNADLSAANASVKQALGSLRSAEAALAKTIIRSPLSGTVNALNVDVGDFVSARDVVSVVANNNALEITAFFGEGDRTQIAVGDIVTIEGRIEGRIARIAPAVNPNTKKVEVKIQTDSDELENGDTVRIQINPSEETITTSNVIRVPLTAIKFTADDAFVFTVEDGVLRAHKVILGKANGANITIEEGISFDTEIVVDARGLNDGVSVNVK